MIRPRLIVRFARFAAFFVLPSSLLLYGAQAAQVGKRRAARHRAASGGAASVTFERDVAPVLAKYCSPCHAGKNPSAGISIVSYKSLAAVLKDRDAWERISQNIGNGHMPPAGSPRPSDSQRRLITAFLDASLSKTDCKIQDPGRVTLRRLNREEYNNTIRDLIGLNLRPADEFPSDDVGYGFDNIGDVLSISPLLMEKYVSAAETVAKAAIEPPGDAVKTYSIQAAKADQTPQSGQVFGDGLRMLSQNGEVFLTYNFPYTGEYELKAKAFGQQAGDEPAKMSLRIDGNEVKEFDVSAFSRNPTNYFERRSIPAGKHRVAFAFTNQFSDPMAKNENRRVRNLVIERLEITGPYGVKPPPSEVQKRIIFVTPKDDTAAAREAAARPILKRFVTRAFRRPATNSEVDRLVRYVDMATKNGETFEKGIQLAVEATLVSPNFLFRVEVDPNPKDSTPRLLGDYELASRLSYFLWSSMPDEELFALAAKGELHKPDVLVAQAKRMLKDSKAKALGDNFAEQWLNLRLLANSAPDSGRFPEFNDTLRKSMRTETKLFFDEVARQDRSVLDFIDGKYTYVNPPLAKLYGLPTISGDGFQRVSLAGTDRGGVLTQASVLTLTSNPTRTSPVKRGKWVLENILGTPPPPAPPDVPKLADDQMQKEPLKGTLKQRMEQHRKNPTCASCHARMDPLGFGLENFDAVGAWRTKDGDSAVDASGTLPDGRSFKGPMELESILLRQKAQFMHCLSEKILTYALGRGMETYDTCAVEQIAKTVATHDYRFSSLVAAVVQSEPFRKRRGDGGTKS